MMVIAELVEALRLLVQGVPGLTTLASAPYLFRPLVMLVVLGVVCAIVGVAVNLRCAEFQAEALVHAVFPGNVAGAVYLGTEGIVPAASLAGVVAAAVLTWVGYRARREASEAGTAVVLTTFFSVGLVLLLAKGDMSGQLEALMFGRLLSATDAKFSQAVLVSVVALVLVALTWKEQVLLAFDQVGAWAGGLRPLALDLLLNMSVAAIVVSSSVAVGTLLAIGYIILPAATGRVLGRSVRSMTLIALGVGVVSAYLGMLAAVAPSPHPVSPQAVVVLIMAVFLVAAVPVRSVLTRVGPWRLTDSPRQAAQDGAGRPEKVVAP